jgi:hypothetical protein
MNYEFECESYCYWGKWEVFGLSNLYRVYLATPRFITIIPIPPVSADAKHIRIQLHPRIFFDLHLRLSSRSCTMGFNPRNTSSSYTNYLKNFESRSHLDIPPLRPRHVASSLFTRRRFLRIPEGACFTHRHPTIDCCTFFFFWQTSLVIRLRKTSSWYQSSRCIPLTVITGPRPSSDSGKTCIVFLRSDVSL